MKITIKPTNKPIVIKYTKSTLKFINELIESNMDILDKENLLNYIKRQIGINN